MNNRSPANLGVPYPGVHPALLLPGVTSSDFDFLAHTSYFGKFSAFLLSLHLIELLRPFTGSWWVATLQFS